jgi:CDP-glycerol glycerophosphotransferase (TagB/SpsB family)
MVKKLLHKAQTAQKLICYKFHPVEDLLRKSSASESQEQSSVDFQSREAILDEFSQILSENGTKLPGKSINDYFFSEKIRPKTVLMVGLGKNVRGNLQYILNELNHNEAFDGFRIYVRTDSSTDGIVKKYIVDNHWDRTETISDDMGYARLMESVQYLLTEVFFPESWVKKPEQVYISIWHGTPLKKLGLAKNQKNKHKSGIIQKNFIDADYLLYPNNYTKEKMLDSYRVSPLLNGKMLMLGYPRTGGMLQTAQTMPEDTRRILAPNGEKIYVYMPTFRDYLENEEVVSMSRDLLDYLDRNLKDDQLLYVNLHHRVGDSIDYSGYTHVRKFPPTVDSYSIMAASDAMISDYSSVFFDYLALRKQIILYINDYETYRTKRGMYMDLMELPFDKATTKEELLLAINRGKTYDDTQTYQEFCVYDSVSNPQKLCQLFRNDETGLQLDAFPRNSKFRFLIYSEYFQSGIETQFLCDFFKRCDKDHYEIYLGCDMEAVDNDKTGAYPLMNKARVIGSMSNPHLSSMGKAVKKLYLENRLPFKQAMSCLKYDYRVMGLRMYGRAEFDSIVIYDVTNPEIILALALLPAPKILFLTDHMIRQIQAGDTFLRDAICYSSRYCSSVFAGSRQGRVSAKEILTGYWNRDIQLLDLSRRL